MNKSWRENNLLREFSMPKAIALDKHYHDAPELIEHLLKIYCFKTDRTWNHWVGEIADRSNYTYKLKTKSKYLSKQEIYKCLTGPIETEEEFDIFYKVKINKLARDYDDIKHLTKQDIIDNESSISLFIYNYIDWVAEELSKNGSIEDIKIENKLKELLK